jgi:lipid A ethanolaminephosphotransferase
MPAMQLSLPFAFPRFFPIFHLSPPGARTRPRVAVWGLALWLASVGNLPLWQRIDGLGGTPTQRLALIVGLGLLLVGALAALLSLLAWPRVLRPAASALLLVAAFNTHFMWQYGVVIDPTMLANVVHTDVREVRDLLSWALPGTVLLVAGLPLWALWRRPLALRSLGPQAVRNLMGALAALALLVAAALMSYQGLASLACATTRTCATCANPLNTVYAAARLAHRPAAAPGALRSCRSVRTRSPRRQLQRSSRGPRCWCWWSARPRARRTSASTATSAQHHAGARALAGQRR